MAILCAGFLSRYFFLHLANPLQQAYNKDVLFA